MKQTQSSIISQNELEANRFVAKIMRITTVMLVLVLVLNLTHIFKIKETPMIICCSINFVLLLIPTLLVNVLKLSHPSLKYIFVMIAIVFVSMTTVVMNWHAILLFIYAIGIASIYFSKPLSIVAIAASMIFMTVAQIFAYNLGVTVDLNQKDMHALILYCLLPRGISLFAVSLIFTSLNSRTSKLLGNLMDADEQARMINHMQKMQDKSLEVSDSLSDAVTTLSTVTDTTNQMNQDIATRTAQVANGSAQSVNQLSDVVQNFDSISQNLNNLASMTNDIARISNSVYTLTANNSTNIDNVIKEMNRINDTTLSSKDTIEHLESRSKEILQIVDVITSISSQTNLLALNAAIESARAGEAGRGFSVVADEIRKLAEQTQGAVSNIKTIVEEVVSNTTKAADSMEDSAHCVTDGLSLIQIAEASTSEVAASSSQMNEMITMIDSVTKDVANSSEKIVNIVHDVQNISSKNLDSLEEVSQSTEANLSELSQLQSLVEQIQAMSNDLNNVVKGN